MKPEEIRNKKILVAPLDWGMGHVTRSLALVSVFIKNDNEIVFAGTQEQINIAQKDFPLIQYELIDGYNIKLDSTKSTYWQMIMQSVKMQSRINKEAEIANDLAAKHQVDVIISDNRYGFKSIRCLNIMLTHQLSPPVPALRKAVTTQMVRWVNNFNFCWVPDDELNPICAELYEVELKIPKINIGFLSRMDFEELEKSIDVLFISSGPEPERSRFEKVIIEMLKTSELKFKAVGQVLSIEDFYVTNPSAKELQDLINASDLVITKAGYTSIMDLIKLKANAVLVPTTGQYEQEFFAYNVKVEQLKFSSESGLNEIFTPNLH